MSAKPAKREYTPPRRKAPSPGVGTAERMRFRPDALTTITDFYQSIDKPSRAENTLLARTDRKELARRNVPLVTYVVTTLLHLPGTSRNGKRAGFMTGAGAKVGFGKEHRRKVDDLIQDGIVGLMRACQTFDPEKASFSTHAIPWIIAAIQNGNSRQGTVHIPSDVQRQSQTEPHVLRDSTRIAVGNALAGNVDIEKDLQQYDAEHINGGSVLRLADILPDTEEPVVENMTARTALDSLDQLERRVVEHRYGIVGPPLDLQATGRKLGMTRREVRETERRAMKKMQAAT